jgi:hypothetical protein
MILMVTGVLDGIVMDGIMDGMVPTQTTCKPTRGGMMDGIVVMAISGGEQKSSIIAVRP